MASCDDHSQTSTSEQPNTAWGTPKPVDRASVPAMLDRSSQDGPTVQQLPEPDEHVSVVHHETIPEILPSRNSSKSRKVSTGLLHESRNQSVQRVKAHEQQELVWRCCSITVDDVQVFPSTIPVERQSINFPGSHGSHTSHGPSALPPHSRASRMLPRHNDADVECQPSTRVDGSNDGIGCIDSTVPSSPVPSMDRLSACSSSGRGQRKVMALHPSHAGMREGIGHHGSYSQPAFLGPAAHKVGALFARDHLVSTTQDWIHTWYRELEHMSGTIMG